MAGPGGYTTSTRGTPRDVSELDELYLLEAQDYRCAGCRNRLTSLRYSEYRWNKHIGGGESWEQDQVWEWEWKPTRAPPSGPREGLLQYKKSRSQGGTMNEMEDMEIMCEECRGTSTRSVRLPNHLLIKSKNWLKNDNPGNVRSFNHLVRLALEKYISTADELLAIEAVELENAKSLKNNLMKEISAMLSAVDEMKERLDRFTD